MHEGHRSRLTGKIKDGGVVYEHELLEVLLFNACPRRDLNATAHALIDRFGDIGGVLSASVDELAAVEGVGRNMAEYIACVNGALERSKSCSGFAVLSCTADFKRYLAARSAPDRDTVEICMTDKDGRLTRICSFRAEEGERAKASKAEVLKYLSVYRPFGVFVANRRTFGGCNPELSDDELSIAASEMAALCGSRFFDYCIVSENGEIFSYFVADRTVFGKHYAGGK